MENDRSRIRTDEGEPTEEWEALGQERIKEFVMGHGELQAMALFLVISMTSAPRENYSDEILDKIVIDAQDVIHSATKWAQTCMTHAAEWRRQRQLDEEASQKGAE